MKDKYLSDTDRVIRSSQNKYLETLNANHLYEVLYLMNHKMTYIATYPERAKNHYNPNQDIPMIKELRRLLGFTQEDLANFLEVARETVSRWETGSIILSDERREQFKTLLDQYKNHRRGDSLFVTFDTLATYNKINKETT